MFEQIAHEVIDLMDQQMKTLLEWDADGISHNDLAAYEDRRQRILALRSQLKSFREA
jgi:very-short-patch-repair endonuclease